MNARHEEAAQLAAEFTSSLENLPQEAQHLLEEINHLDVKSEELAAKIAMETKKYLHHLCGNAGRTRPSKDAAPAAVGRMYEELDAIGAEKVALAGRLAEKLERALARLQDTLQKIVKLEGDEAGCLPPTQEFLENIDSTVRQITGLRAAAAQALDTPPAPPVASSTSAPQPRKKRETAASAGRGKASSSAPAVSGRRNTSQKSAPSRSLKPKPTQKRPQRAAVRPKRRRSDSGEVVGKENEHEGIDGEDEGPYCYCREGDWGEMIGCDNINECAIEWFHISCVGLTPPLPDKWYCDECKKSMGVPRVDAPAASGPAVRKGQKKQ